MKYAFNTWCYGSFPTWLPSYGLDDVIKRLARIGYHGIEIGCAAPHAWPAYLNAARRKQIKALLDAEGLRAASLLPAPGGGPGNNPASPLREERRWTAQHYKDVVDLAADLGAPTVLYIAGWQVFPTPAEDAWQWSVEVLRDVAAHAQEKGIQIAVEPTPADSNLVETADDALRMMREAEAPNVKVMFDTFHALYRREVPADYVTRMGEHLAHIHLSDHDRLPPGSGGMDFLPLLQAVKESGFDGYLSMEIGFASRAVHPDSIARQALEHMKSLEASLA